MESQFQFDWQAAINSIPFLLEGIPYTLMISFGGLLIGFAWHWLYFFVNKVQPV